MSYTSEFENITSYFQNNWERSYGNVSVAWPNIPFTPPSPPSPWVRFNLVDASCTYISVGSPGKNVSRYMGQVIVQVFIPTHTGSLLGLELVDYIAGLFRNRKIENIRFSSVYSQQIDTSISDGWLQYNLTAPFTRDEFE